MEQTIFGKNVSKIRKSCGMTQEQLAQKMNVSPQAVSKWEKSSYPDGELLPLLAKRLNTSLDVLFGLKEKETEVDLEQLITDEIRRTEPEKRAELMMSVFYSALCAYNDYAISKAVLPKNLELETYAELKTDYEIAIARLNENLQYFCFLSVPSDGVNSYTDASPLMVRIFEMLADEDALNIIYYLGSGIRNRMQTKEVISKRLNIPVENVSRVMDKLDRFGFVWRISAESSESSQIVYGYTYSTALTILITLAKSLTNYIHFCEPLIDKWNTGAFRMPDKTNTEPIPQVSFWDVNDNES